MQDAVAQQLDDMRRLLGTVIGQNNDILQNRRSYEVDLPPANPGLKRLEDLLRRALYRLGDSDMMDEDGLFKDPSQKEDEMTTSGKEGSWYEGGGSIYSGEFRPKYEVPNGSLSNEAHRRLLGGPSPIPSELLDPYAESPDFDAEFAITQLPPATPPSDFVAPRTTLPPQLADHLRNNRQHPQHPMQATVESVYTEDAYSEDDHETSPPSEVLAPIPIRPRPAEDDDDATTSYGEDEIARGPARQLPPPAPVDLPTPVGSRENVHMHGSGPGPGPSIRPGYPANQYAGLPPPPGMGQMPRPSMPRIAGQRDPISTT